MAEVKGLSIIICGNLMSFDKKHIGKANEYLKEITGLETYEDLKPDEWYDTKIYGKFMDILAEASVTKDYAYVILGKRIYPRLQKMGLVPANIKTPLDYLKYEAVGFLANHRGVGVIPRKFIKASDKDIVVYAPAPGYNSKLYEGVFLGILEMCEIKTGKVSMNGVDTFHITW